MTMHLIVNSLSGGYSLAVGFEIEAGLKQAGYVPKQHVVTTLEGALQASTAIQASEPEPYIVVAGGDGTINAVLNGLLPGRATLAVIPVGTANVLAQELGIVSVDDAVRRIAAGASRVLSVGAISIAGKKRYFSLMAGVGVDGAIVGGVGKREKQLLKKWAYGLSALRTLWHWDRRMLKVYTDREEVICHSVIVSNATRYAGRFLLAPEQSLSLPSLTALCITSQSRFTYAKLVLTLLLGRKPSGQGVYRFVARNLTVVGNKPVQVDGDFVGYGPVDVHVVYDFARIIR